MKKVNSLGKIAKPGPVAKPKPVCPQCSNQFMSIYTDAAKCNSYGWSGPLSEAVAKPPAPEAAMMPTEPLGLVRYDAMCSALAASERVDEVKEIRDRAAAFE